MKKSIKNPVFLILFLLALSVIISRPVYAEVGVGSTKAEVIAAFGEPSGVIESGNEEILSYPGGMIVILDGKVQKMDSDFAKKLGERKEEIDFASSQEEKGLVEHMGQWITKDEKKKIENKIKLRHSIMKYSNGGKQLELSEILVPDKITVVDFYADWCEPCQKLAPYLENLAKNDEDVYLRKIDIVKWGTPITKQFSINSIPDIRVFDKYGRMVGRPTYNFKELILYIQKCKQM